MPLEIGEEEEDIVDGEVDTIEALVVEIPDASGVTVLETEVHAGVFVWLKATRVPAPTATAIIDTTAKTMTLEIAR